MKKIFLVIFFSLIFSNLSFSKTLDVGLHKLEVPNNFYLIDLSILDFSDDMCKEFEICYGLIDKKAKDVLDDFQAGKKLENIKIIKPLVSKYNRMINSKSPQKAFKSFMNKLKSILKKNDSGTWYDYYSTENDINEILNLSDYDTTIEEIREMSKSELNEFTSDLRSELTLGNNNYYPINEDLTVKIKKFNMSKNQRGNPYFVLQGKLIYNYYTTKISADVAWYISEINKKLFMFDGVCLVNCSNFFSNFNQIVDKSFSGKSLSKKGSQSNNVDLLEQLNSLNDLYKSGVLTKEEFEKAKKKILN